MRKPILFLAVIALATAACASSASTTAPNAQNPAPPQHNDPTAAPPRYEPAPSYAAEEPQPTSTPYDGVTYQDPGVNPFVPADKDRKSTFALDVDTASYTIAQRYLADGNLPDPAAVRVEEFVNAFDQGYAAPDDGTFAISADGGPTPFLADGEVLLRVGVKARDVARFDRPDASLTFVIDTSGSMGREDRLGLAKQSLRFLVDRLRSRDTVAIVAFGTNAQVVLEPTRAADKDTIDAAIDSLETSGSTNAEAGLRLGYQLAAETLNEAGINRVILASDGVANMGAIDPQEILRRIRPDAEAGVQLVTVGFGMGNYNDTLMEQLADKGDGFYAYVNTFDDARSLFGTKLTSTLDTVALDAKAQVEFNPQVVDAYRLLGYENRDVPDASFRDDTVDAGAIGAGHAATALYALRLTGGGEGLFDKGTIGTVRIRWTDPTTHKPDEIAREVHVDDLARSFAGTAPTFKLDAIVAAAAERFRQSRYAERYSASDVASLADEVTGDLPDTDQVQGLLQLLDEAASLDR